MSTFYALVTVVEIGMWGRWEGVYTLEWGIGLLGEEVEGGRWAYGGMGVGEKGVWTPHCRGSTRESENWKHENYKNCVKYYHAMKCVTFKQN
jgi:hypothetical protein